MIVNNFIDITQLNDQSFVCNTVSMSNSSIWPIDRTLLGATTLGQSRSGSDDNEGVPRISKSSSITGASPSDCLMSYPGTLQRYTVYSRPTRLKPTGLSLVGREFYSSAEMQSVYSTALPLPQPTGRCIVIYEALCFDVAQGWLNGAPNETRTHSCRFASQARKPLHYPRCPYWAMF